MERATDEGQLLGDLEGISIPAFADEWVKGTPEDWATDTPQVAKKAYCLPETQTVIQSGTALGDSYYRMALPLIQMQLAKAGVRVAWTLNEIFR